MTIAQARVLVTTDVLYRRKVEPVRAQMPALEHVLLIRETADSLPSGTHDFNELLDAASDDFTISPSIVSSPAPVVVSGRQTRVSGR